MTLEAKVTALTADAGDDAATMTVQVYDAAAPLVIVWQGEIPIQLNWPPERVTAELDKLTEQIGRRQAAIVDLQNILLRPRKGGEFASKKAKA